MGYYLAQNGPNPVHLNAQVSHQYIYIKMCTYQDLPA